MPQARPMDDVPLYNLSGGDRRGAGNGGIGNGNGGGGEHVRYDPAQTDSLSSAIDDIESSAFNETSYDPDLMQRVHNVDEEFAHLAHVAPRQPMMGGGEGRVMAFCRSSLCKCMTLIIVVSALCGILLAGKGGGGDDDQQSGGAVELIDMTHTCQKSSLATADGLYECTKACEDAQCCHLDDDAPGSCRKGNEELCWKYSVGCEELKEYQEGLDAETSTTTTEPTDADTGTDADSDGAPDDSLDDALVVIDIPPPPLNLESLCDPSNLSSTEGFAACLEACGPSSCCQLSMGDPGLCLESNAESCAEYYGPCLVLGDSAGGGGGGGGGAETTTTTTTTSTVAAAAVTSTTTTTTTMTTTTTTEQTTTTTKPPGGHDGGDDERPPPAPIDLEEKCLQDDITDCLAICSVASCCFRLPDDPESCFHTYAQECTLYEPCSDVILTFGDEDSDGVEGGDGGGGGGGGGDGLPPAPIDLEEKCLMDDTTDCLAACDLALCCFRPKDDPTSCFESNEMACTLYDPCVEIIEDAEEKNVDVPYPPVNLGDMCLIDDLISCTEVCNKALPCCQENECYQVNEGACLMYHPCDVLPNW